MNQLKASNYQVPKALSSIYKIALYPTPFCELLCPKNMSENDITKEIINQAFYIHKILGPGLLESAYKECLYYKLKSSGLSVYKELGLPLYFEEVSLDCGYRIDLLVESKVIIEVKSCDGIKNVHLAQLLTYLRLSDRKVGLLLNFNEYYFKEGIRRVVNGL